MSQATDREFAEFVAAHSDPLLRVAFLLTGEQAAAEDLLQNALVRLYLVWHRLDTSEPPIGYLRRVLYTSHVSSWRRHRLPETLTADPPERPAGSDDYATSDERDRLWRLVSRLPTMQRAVIVLRYYEDLPEFEIAALLRISPGSVKVHASRGLRRLRALEGCQPAQPTQVGG